MSGLETPTPNNMAASGSDSQSTPLMCTVLLITHTYSLPGFWLWLVLPDFFASPTLLILFSDCWLFFTLPWLDVWENFITCICILSDSYYLTLYFSCYLLKLFFIIRSPWQPFSVLIYVFSLSFFLPLSVFLCSFEITDYILFRFCF